MGGCALVLSFGSPIVQTVILSSFSTVLGSQPQGTFSHQSSLLCLADLFVDTYSICFDHLPSIGTLMGLITMAGSVGRIVFPLSISVLDEQGMLRDTRDTHTWHSLHVLTVAAAWLGSFVVGAVLSAVCIGGILCYSTWVRCLSRPTHLFVTGFPEPIHS